MKKSCHKERVSYKMNTMDKRTNIKGHLCMAGAASMWGLMAPLAKDAMQNGLGGLSMVGIRVAGGCLCFWLTS